MKEGYRKAVKIWLATGALLVIAMVVIGGITRLTHSGLSMVDWKPITGVIPPLNEADWQTEFDAYKQFPEFQKLNYDFTLEDFKSILWWEFIHRVLGRVIGIVFIVPFIFFLIRKVFNKTWVIRLTFLFLLGGLQGVIGWFMVKSGLVDNPDVSHYRLAIHFMAALTVYSYIVWLFLLMDRPPQKDSNRSIKTWSVAMLVLTALQLIYGTFVAGLQAGLFYNTWPMMDGSLMSPAVSQNIGNLGIMALFEDPTTIQFIHRMLPYLLLGCLVILWQKTKYNPLLFKATKLLSLFWGIQVVLGIITLVTQVPVTMGVLHQLGGVLYLTGVIYLLFPQARFSQSLDRLG